ncbi:MAG: dTDP-4-dehydrorhamnose 3,5-epimerase family protein [Gammaproteobacteria bacterium]|nr:dTDP-4-dehydrorhamnose 3,5-epimerase family protein [Gammaproteobacteria bacterium]MDJ0873307.1 dTDP-4-dehydrorhamnose 3,5-epimerase family protein [Gammaproteobacteria bacterium]MDJ0890906.1 dTDP-4-dehydrorhamnose 3,5-epimerase family protein [Gammaproteobacteria bacterium]
MRLQFATQAAPEGIAQAFIIGRDFIAGSRCCLTLGGNLFCRQGLTRLLERGETFVERLGRGAAWLDRGTCKGVLGGFHSQEPNAQGKLVFLLEGEVFDVAVDIRAGSPTWGRWTVQILSGENRRQLYIPAAYARGFWATSEDSLVLHKCTAP